ncbi:PAS domain-containing sensor histidine kinase [Spirosoma oryzicola]|uniref:PAS domain-containing sensor histidine kinase n=1 Tax=Spirosoma oryzicola TaxID=2898794 RepID=UPI001E4C59C8|nr:ATP-binding protein [Spirosoma oryzicola]UHG93933.1 PAS domain-containing protein [Spirosoma oryzicola]
MMDQSSYFPFLPNSQAEQERLRYAIQAAQVGTWHFDISQQQVWWDKRCQELFGSQESGVIAYRQLLELVYEEDRQRFSEAIKVAFDPSSAGYYDVQFRTVGTQDGQPHWLHCQGRAYVDVLGAAYRLSGVARDITVQVHTQQQLEASKARFRSIVLNSPTPTVLFVGRDMVIDTVNMPMLQIWGKDESVMGQSLYQAVPELASQPLLEQLQRVYDRGEAYKNTKGKAKVVVDEQWQQSWFNFSYNPVYTEEGTIFGFIHTATDVTREVLALQQLQRSEVRFRSLIEEAPVATCLLVGREFKIEVANEFISAIFSGQKELIGQPLVDALPELRNQPLLAILGKVFDTGETYSTQGARADFFVDGAPRTNYVDCTAKPLFNEQGEVYAILVMATDVTKQVLAQQVIQRSEEQKTFLLQLTDQLRSLTSPSEVYYQAACLLGPYLGVDRIGYAQEKNDRQSVLIMPNYTNGVDDWQGEQSFADYGPLLAGFDDNRIIVRPDVANDPTLGEQQKEAHRLRQLGSTLNKPLVLKDGSVTILFIHYRQARYWTADELMLVDDVSARLVIAVERAKAEQALRESELKYRLLSEQLEQRVSDRTQELVQANQDLKRSNDNLQQFAYVASHDLQEPLRKIQSFSSLLSGQLEGPSNETAQSHLLRISSAGARMSTLIKDLLAYSRISTRQQVFGPVSLTGIITEVLSLLDWQIEQSDAQIKVDEMPVIKGDETQLTQLFQNLLANALKFVAPGKKPQVHVQYFLCPQKELPAVVQPSIQTSHYHQINVIDQGVGFDIKYLDRIFQVFQRLHSMSEFSGTGVGLAICQRVVENHGGGITASSEPGQGSTFSVYLPV